ncbi:LysR family transcriptional regulator [Bradyrhizobium sp. CIAT3101]|uniref:LysR family transcriptional regulator n=1 Tax=Bradyrhizobium sp. CIAT3101 TaxID=439387 RepID=UPI0024B255EE|nr:LysR family transcriptional regulator [Bradyrhizobium sp. CIAT3101]WFU81736.1 LysR family transcriptional regulator [Bradyrhizobium sp. CIAT3101]
MSVEETNNPASFKLHDLRCFDAVARLGSFQAAANALHRTHPSVFAAVTRLEQRLGLTLLDRSGYRVELTEVGRMFHARAATSLRDIDNLDGYARQLATGEEPVLRVVLGDLCDRPAVLGTLSAFFAGRPRTRLHLDYEAVSGPFERLADGSADLIFHRVDDSRYDLEQIRFREIRLLPVAAPGFLAAEAGAEITPRQLQLVTQCVIRDTARDTTPEDHFLIDGAPHCSVPDHTMKKELILHRMAWGHLPEFMVENELRTGKLINMQGRYIPGRTETLAAMRRIDRPHGPVAEELWECLKDGLPRM